MAGKGGHCHEYQIDLVENPCRGLGAECMRNVQSRPGDARSGVVDLLAILNGKKIAFEIEMPPVRRAAADVAKALDFGADLLVIVVPNYQGAQSAKRQLANQNAPQGQLTVHVLTVGQTIARLQELFSLDE